MQCCSNVSPTNFVDILDLKSLKYSICSSFCFNSTLYWVFNFSNCRMLSFSFSKESFLSSLMAFSFSLFISLMEAWDFSFSRLIWLFKSDIFSFSSKTSLSCSFLFFCKAKLILDSISFSRFSFSNFKVSISLSLFEIVSLKVILLSVL